jgi:2-dehydro-3-deoxygluconokinase
VPRFYVATIGEGQLRYCIPAGKRLEEVKQFEVYACGAEANVTSLLSRLGWNCGWLSSLPNSPLGRRITNELKLSGLDLSAILWRDHGRVATYYVEYAEPPRSTQIYYDRAHSCFAGLSGNDVDWEYLTDTQILHLTGITPALSPGLREIVDEAAAKARSKGALISLDVNYRSRLWTPEEARQALLPIMREANILFCSRNDAAAVFGISGAPDEIVRKLGDLTAAKFIVVSLSSEGLVGWDRKQCFKQPAAEVRIIDRIGAGDAMVGGVLHGILQNKFQKGLHYGALTAALALSQFGDLVITTPEELELLVDTQERRDIHR